MRILIPLIAMALAGCATTPSGNETSALRGNLAVIGKSTRESINDGKQILTDLQGAERDAKQIRAILFPSRRK